MRPNQKPKTFAWPKALLETTGDAHEKENLEMLSNLAHGLGHGEGPGKNLLRYNCRSCNQESTLCSDVYFISISHHLIQQEDSKVQPILRLGIILPPVNSNEGIK